MCCFSRPVPYVAGTKIFARAHDDERQALVYSMAFTATEELAMILPLPVPPSPGDDAVRFTDLSDYDDFFTDMERGFPKIMLQSRGGGPLSFSAQSAPLKVHDVGDYEASFVPRLADFDRLDARFKLAPEVWEKLPQYADWGFAVFKLKPKSPGFMARIFRIQPKPRSVHPMAFEFPRRDPESLFFPTVHVHDGEVHERERFDHQLYCQPGPSIAKTLPWEPSDGPIGKHIEVSRAQGLIDASEPVFRRTMLGDFPNQDQLLTAT